MKRSIVPVILATLALVCTLGFTPSLRAQIRTAAFVCDSNSGQIIADTTWSPADCPSGYIITGNVLVQQGITLTIMPGTLVKFNPTPTLTIDGKLVARGTAASPIRFTANKATPMPGDWNGIVFNTNSTDATFDGAGNYTGGSIIQYALIEYGGSGFAPVVNLNYASPYLDHNTIRNNKTAGVSGNIESQMRLSANTIQDNQGDGINLSTGVYSSNRALDVIVTGNAIARNTGDGITLYSYGGQGAGVAVVSGNTVQDNIGTGFTIQGVLETTLNGNTIRGSRNTGVYINATKAQVIGNSITGNTGNTLYCVGGIHVYSSEGQISGNTIANNAAYDSYCSYGNPHTGGIAVSGIAVNGQLTVSGNTISGNTIGGGIEAYEGKPIINYNNISGNTIGTPPTPRNLTANSYSSSDPTLDVKNNWWGTTSVAEIEASIYDYADNTSYNEAIYNPFRSGQVYAISGRITNSQGQPIAGVTVSAGTNLTATTDANGAYFLSGLDAGSYTLTPTRTNFVFNPPTLSVSVASTNLADQNFTGTQTSYSLSGRIADKQGTAMTGVTVSDGAGHSSATDASGNYILSGLSTGAYTIVPTQNGYTFTPPSLSVNVQQQDVSGQDFTGEIVYYTISGAIRDRGGNPISYARVDAGSGRTAYTDSAGAYTFKDLQYNAYTIIPSYGSYTFDPAQTVVNVGPSATDVNFTGTDPNNQYTLAGQVTDRSGMALAGVVVSNGNGITAATDANGNYRFDKLPRGDYTLTPQLSDYFFAPRSQVVSVAGNTSGVRFVGGRVDGSSLLINYPDGKPGSYFTVVGTGYAPNQTAQILVSGRVLGTVTTDASGGFSVILSTTQANSATYTIRAIINSAAAAALSTASSAVTSFTLAPTAPLRAKEGSGAELSVPAGLNRTFVYLPLIVR